PLVVLSPNSATLAAGGEDGTVNLWDVRTGRREEPLRWNDGPGRSVAFSLDGRLLAAGGGRTVQVIDGKAGRQLRPFRGETLFTNLAFSPDGKTLAATSDTPDARTRGRRPIRSTYSRLAPPTPGAAWPSASVRCRRWQTWTATA